MFVSCAAANQLVGWCVIVGGLRGTIHFVRRSTRRAGIWAARRRFCGDCLTSVRRRNKIGCADCAGHCPGGIARWFGRLARRVTSLRRDSLRVAKKCSSIFDHGLFVFYIHLATSHRPTERALVRHAARQQPNGEQQDTSMRQRVLTFSRLLAKLFALVAIVAQAAAAHAQVAQPALQPSIQQPITPKFQPVAGAANAFQNAITRVLESGRTLEVSGRWADALTQYEEALHEYPEDQALQARFDVARLHYSLDQRYEDRSFRDSLRTMNAAAGAGPIQRSAWPRSTPTTTPNRPGSKSRSAAPRPWTSPWRTNSFLRNHGVRVRGQQVEQLRTEISQLPGRYAIRSARDASSVAVQIARLARQRVGCERNGHAARIHVGRGRRFGSLLGLSHRRSAPRHLLADRRQLRGPGRRAESRQRRTVDRPRHSAQPRREGRHPRRRSHHRRRWPGDESTFDRRSRLAPHRRRGQRGSRHRERRPTRPRAI